MAEAQSTGPAGLECGQRFRRPPAGGLTLTAHFPAAVGASELAIRGTVEVTGGDRVIRGLVSPLADVYLVRHGQIVTLPLPQDLLGKPLELAPGQVESLPAEASLTPCEGGRPGSLPPGAYELYARVVVYRDDESQLESIGGPWPLEVH